ncbi:unnamed protein product [Moneuplotes crassus]|uniref:Uncharacterized protein n=1 Tax=Euplotes crassus TaxID=5936 RepID=A0AAD1XBR1_EUPCR|nr:unnamed protein product [Moneuplotes crassus]
MSKLVNPLALLKDYFQANKKIHYKKEARLLVLGKTSISVEMKTAWTKKASSSQYSVGSLWFCYSQKQQSVAEYLQLSASEGFERVSLLDRLEVIDYFDGKLDDVKSIDKAIISSTLVKIGQVNKFTENCAETEKPQGSIADKRQKKAEWKSEEEKKISSNPDHKYAEYSEAKRREIQVMEYLAKRERRVLPKNHGIEFPEISFAKIHRLCSELTHEEPKGDALLKKVKKEGVKKILDVNIPTLRKKKRVSFLDEILNSSGSSERKPIIVVPPISDHSKLCYSNAIDFFTKGIFIDGNDARKASGQNQYSGHQEFEYMVGTKLAKFDLYDSILGFNKSHWRRVVAYFAQAEEWELKDFPPKESPDDIFQKSLFRSIT